MLDPATAFRDLKKAGAGWSAHCPAHDDRRSSLSIGIGDAGRILLKCHAGCALDDILAAAHLDHADLFPETTTPTIIATYRYLDEGGRHLSDAVRLSPKDFRQRRADGTWSMKGVRRVLYHLDKLQGQTVAYVVEGEKDADRLRVIGLPGTTNVGGAGKWKPEYVAQLKAATVEQIVIIPDNDDPGRAHADAVARSCHLAGLQVKIVTLPDLPTKGDVSDWLDAGHTKADLVALVKAAPLFTPASIASTPAATAGPVVVRLADVQAETVSYVWPHRIARSKLNLIVGDPGLGKSQITLDGAARVSRGAAWPDGGRAPLGDVILLSAEDGLADTIRPRLDALDADVTRVHALTAIRSAHGDERGFCLASDIALLEQVIERTGAMLVIIDPISAYLGATDSYKDGEVRGVLAPLAALAERADVAIVGVMHLGKGAQRPALYRALGSIAFVAAARIVLAVAPHPEDETRRVLAPVKANVCAPAAVLSFSLGAGRLAWDTDPVAGLDIDALLSATGTDHQEYRDADDFLRELLTDGEQTVKQVQQAARDAGIGWRTVERAKHRLHIQSDRLGYGDTGRWYWRLPEAANTPESTPKTAIHDQVAVYEDDSINPPVFAASSSKTATQTRLAVNEALSPPVAESDALGVPDDGELI
jgi:hypothetical protein